MPVKYAPPVTPIMVTKTNTCNGNGAQTDNIFKLIGTVKIVELYGICTRFGNSTDFADVSFALYDGSSTVEITDANAPTDASGLGVGGGIYCNGASASVAVSYITSDACTVTDVGNVDRIVNQKPGTNTYIQLLFNGDNDTDLDLKVFCSYEPRSDASSLTAV